MHFCALSSSSHGWGVLLAFRSLLTDFLSGNVLKFSLLPPTPIFFHMPFSQRSPVFHNHCDLLFQKSTDLFRWAEMCMFFSDVHVLRFSLQRSAGLHLPSRACTFMQHSISIPGHRGWAALAGHSGQPSFPSARCPRGTAWAHLPGTRALPLPTRASEGPADVPRLLDVQSGPQAKRPCWPGGRYPLENTGKLCHAPAPS